ncbi:hypothetical protein AB0P07_14525 [Streptomyces sp. NPDC085944]|uniref:hypothetical protein n=1 Tax=Streptomyces sp. NPDC085944 TaxID=3154962 RepID=UPI003443BC48
MSRTKMPKSVIGKSPAGRWKKSWTPGRRATRTRLHGVRHPFAAYDMGKDQLHGHI